jgi:hypothetical protein
MRRFRMKFLIFSLCLVAWSCAAPYQSLKSIAIDQPCIGKNQPQLLATNLFSASIDVVGKHLSGLLFIKAMPDQSHRVVFTSETGITFFDFEYKGGGFEVKQAMPQLRKKIVINTLRKDFETLIGIPFQEQRFQAWSLAEEKYVESITKRKERFFFVTDSDCAYVKRLEVGTKKPMFSILMEGQDVRSPEGVVITHHTFNMVINLKKVKRHVSE